MNDTIDSALLMATRGYRIDTLIVTKSEDGDPMVSMFILNADIQLFRVVYDASGGITFKVEDLDDVIFSRSQLEIIAKMQVLADRKWKQIQQFWVDGKETWEGFESLLDDPDERWKLTAFDPSTQTPN